MIGLDYVLAGYLHLAGGAVKCEPKRTPTVAVTASDIKIHYDHTKSQKQLDGFDIDTISPYDAKIQSHVGGLMSGEVRISQSLQFMQETYPAINSGCLFINYLDVKIVLSPTIYISKEYAKGSCMYNAVMEHERKHVELDRQIINKYTGLLIGDLKTYLQRTGYKYGPMSIRKIPEAQKAINETLGGFIRQYSKTLNDERKRRQQDIDTREEYDRVNNLCR